MDALPEGSQWFGPCWSCPLRPLHFFPWHSADQPHEARLTELFSPLDLPINLLGHLLPPTSHSQTTDPYQSLVLTWVCLRSEVSQCCDSLFAQWLPTSLNSQGQGTCTRSKHKISRLLVFLEMFFGGEQMAKDILITTVFPIPHGRFAEDQLFTFAGPWNEPDVEASYRKKNALWVLEARKLFCNVFIIICLNACIKRK